jgi:hypothetical protein
MCKATVVHALQPRDPTSRINFCNWFPHLFHMMKMTQVSSPNNLCWSSGNPRLIHEVIFNLFKRYTVCACTGKTFSAPYIILISWLYCYGAILDLYRENLLALGGESRSFCRLPASNIWALLHHRVVIKSDYEFHSITTKKSIALQPGQYTI